MVVDRQCPPEELRDLVGTGKAKRVAEALRGMPEAERKTLSTTTQELLKASRNTGTFTGSSAESATVFALGPWSAGRRITIWDLQVGTWPKFEWLAGPILIDRRPPWAADWVEARLAIEDGRPLFQVLEELRDAGVIERPEASGNWAQQFLRFLQANRKGGTERYRAGTTDLNGELLHLLRCDPPAWSTEGATIIALLEELIALGEMDRDVVLDATLAGATRGHGPVTSAGVLRAHDALKPTPAERDARAQSYLDLLGSPHSAVVAAGLKGVSAVLKTKAVDPGALIDALRPGWSCAPRPTPRRRCGCSPGPPARTRTAGSRRTTRPSPPCSTSTRTCRRWRSRRSASGPLPPPPTSPPRSQPPLPIWPPRSGSKRPPSSLAPLRQRLGDEVTERWLRPGLPGLATSFAAALCGYRSGGRRFAHARACGPAIFMERRVEAVTRRVRRSGALPLLAAPTHEPAWIDPRALVRRLRTWTEAGEPIDRLDLIQALLRLAPEHRAEALAEAPVSPSLEWSAVRFALGGDADGLQAAADGDQPTVPEEVEIEPGVVSAPPGCLGQILALFGKGLARPARAAELLMPGRAHTPLAVAALRARHPRAEAVAGIVGTGPDGASPGTIRWRIKSSTNRWKQTVRTLVTEASPSLQLRTPVHLPTVLLHRGTGRVWNWAEGEVARARVLAGIWPAWPAWPEGLYFRGAGVIVAELDAAASAWRSAAGHIEAAVDPDATWTPGTVLIAATAFCSRDADARAIALDAMISAIDDGRCTGEQLGSTLLALHRHEILKLNRLGDALREAARISPLHSHAVGRLLCTFLADLGTPPKRDMHHPLELLREVLVREDAPLPEACRPTIEQVTGSGKAAKALLKRTDPAAETPRKALFALALQGRLDRAQRYAASTSDA